MNFFERELKKIIGAAHPDAVYSGRVCYIRLGELTRARLEFVTLGYADSYEALKATILNRTEGHVDSLILRFGEQLGKKRVNNPNFSDGISPHIWRDGEKFEWRIYQPTKADYRALDAEVENYLGIFMDGPALSEQTGQQQF